MEITPQLLAAIQAKFPIKPPFDNYTAYQQARDSELKKFLKLNPEVVTLLAESKKLHTQKSEVDKKLGEYGLANYGNPDPHIISEKQFQAKGGTITYTGTGYCQSQVIALLAGVTKEAGLEILKSLGINWS